MIRLLFGRKPAGGQQDPTPYAHAPSILQDTWSAVVIAWIEDQGDEAGPER